MNEEVLDKIMKSSTIDYESMHRSKTSNKNKDFHDEILNQFIVGEADFDIFLSR